MGIQLDTMFEKLDTAGQNQLAFIPAKSAGTTGGQQQHAFIFTIMRYIQES